MNEKIEFDARARWGADNSTGHIIVLNSVTGRTMLLDNVLDNRPFHVTLTPIEPELKPCPFCGGSATVSDNPSSSHGEGLWIASCDGPWCGAEIVNTTKEGVCVDWNRRA